jgi:hypothetical protein
MKHIVGDLMEFLDAKNYRFRLIRIGPVPELQITSHVLLYKCTPNPAIYSKARQEEDVAEFVYCGYKEDIVTGREHNGKYYLVASHWENNVPSVVVKMMTDNGTDSDSDSD